MAILPQNQRDQVKLLIGFAALALAAVYYLYPYSAREVLLADELTRVAALEDANQRAAREFASGSIETLRAEAAENRSALLVMRRLVPTGNEVPALLEEISTAARRAGLDVGSVTPEPVIAGRNFDTYRYTVTIIGGYHQFGEFLANVGSLARIVAPVNFSIVTGSGASAPRSVIRTSEKDALAATITLQTYVEKTAPPRPRAKERTS
ncbi:MAG: type 4a pilus biogenesis protein PilO [Gemmatimonadota bacterium]|nr:type 4a pilus biogenesis protein PilO [Gemmatimonadota bacterium]MDQ8172996.1 type 4a pilus biogenesis protein PilO [Gemmatimonadota bacterium]